MKQYFELYQDCFIVKGAKNILLCDVHFNKILDITHFYDIFIKDHYFPVDNNLLEITAFLIEEKFGILTKKITLENFRKKFKWRVPNKITEVIIEHKIKDNFDTAGAYKIIEGLSASFLQIRFLEFSLTRLNEILSFIEFSCIRTAEVLLPYTGLPQDIVALKILEKNPRVKTVYFYNAPENKSILDNDNLFTVIYYEKNITNPKYCGIIQEDYFLNDINNISKSNVVNNCLYGKLFISVSGELKNCPSAEKTINNIDKVSITFLTQEIDKQKERFITKNQIDVCKDCEYRYFCTDCRMYRENPENIFSKPLKCGYDPYKGIWKDWSKNPLKLKAIKYYELENLN
ncbi:grasp-with-spasm system SPASM domain peptide maturase [Chryseobacterium sp. G0186]|uniref:grasp-with-spasm system SPASM domain peptide maturase n=1 Tax=Chryseobacterium sp. G0186 TaxID=2487064 RepID=UPI000F4F312F|nr:grasp-with-spasm system SPASM domain peptide maturase [Chryseobacterium sp. G0186]AZA79845.1 grasp-with-spasm system SPASM domain peptide maturase [Chryseobacterium sp. G0186]